MLSYLPGGDQVPGVAAPSVGDQIVSSVHLPKRLNAPFAVIVAGINRLDDLRIIEDQGSFQKIDFPLLPVFPPLAVVPRK
jgi:hypothetical protein